MRPSLHRITRVRVYLLPVQTRVPLKFGAETLTSATVLRVALEAADENNRRAEGWGETPLSVQWVWPSLVPYSVRHDALVEFSFELARAWQVSRRTATLWKQATIFKPNSFLSSGRTLTRSVAPRTRNHTRRRNRSRCPGWLRWSAIRHLILLCMMLLEG